MLSESYRKETSPDAYFCAWCNVLVAEVRRGTRAGRFVRFVALRRVR